MKRTYLVNDLVWIGIALGACAGGLRLGFGSFPQPEAGFLPFLSGLVLGLLALADLIGGLVSHWSADRADAQVWAEIGWGKLAATVVALFLYTALFSTLGFVAATILLLLFLYRLMQPRPWWVVVTASVLTTGVLYLAFRIALDSQLPRGLLGF